MRSVRSADRRKRPRLGFCTALVPLSRPHHHLWTSVHNVDKTLCAGFGTRVNRALVDCVSLWPCQHSRDDNPYTPESLARPFASGPAQANFDLRRHSGAMRVEVGCCRLGQSYSPNSGKPEVGYRTRNLEIPRCAIAHLRSGAGAPSRNDGGRGNPRRFDRNAERSSFSSGRRADYRDARRATSASRPQAPSRCHRAG